MTKFASSSCASALQSAISVSRLSARDIASISKAREGRWRPELADQPRHSEIFASADDASGAGLALALARDALKVAAQVDDPLAQAEDRRQVLWVQDARSAQRSGRPYAHGLPHDLADRLIHVEAARPEDVLFALEEGLKCRDLACVIGEISGNPKALDFTASRRLSLAAEKHNIALWLVRLDAAPELSSARMRWRVEPAVSTAPHWNRDAPGEPAWKAELFRAKRHAPGEWIVSNERGSLRARRPNEPVPANTQDPTNTGYSTKTGHDAAQNIGNLVRPTFGRSLAAVARM